MANKQYANVIFGKTVRYLEENDNYLYIVFTDHSAFLWEYTFRPTDKWTGNVECERVFFPDKAKANLLTHRQQRGNTSPVE